MFFKICPMFLQKETFTYFWSEFHYLCRNPSNWAFVLYWSKSQTKSFNPTWEVRRGFELLGQKRPLRQAQLQSGEASDAISNSTVYVSNVSWTSTLSSWETYVDAVDL